MNDHTQICCCHEVTFGDMKKAVKNGTKTFAAFQELTQAGTDCPPCKVENEEWFNQLLEELE